jgi:hypothetical protein
MLWLRGIVTVPGLIASYLGLGHEPYVTVTL